MVGILVVSHGKMAEGMLDTMGMVVGEMDQVSYTSLAMGEDFDVFELKVADKIRSLDDGTGVLVLVDLYGASPFNAAQKAAHFLESEGIAVRILSGVNLGMLVEAVAARNGITLAELAEMAKEAGRMCIGEPVQVAVDEDDY